MSSDNEQGAPEPQSMNGSQSLSIGFKLNGRSVYTSWRFAMTTLLTAYGLDLYVDSSKKVFATDPVKKAKDMLAITRNLELNQLTLIKSHANDPAGAWDALSKEYAGSTNQDMATLLIELFGKRLVENATVEQAKSHFESMTDLNLRLKEIDANRALPDLVIAVLMCMSLPNDMEQIRYKRLSGPSTELTPTNIRDDVVSLLRRLAVTDQVTGTGSGHACRLQVVVALVDAAAEVAAVGSFGESAGTVSKLDTGR